MLEREYYRTDGQKVNSYARFWAKVDKTPTCWNWTGAKHSFGYGSVRISRRAYKAHRVSYEWLIGPIPEGMCLLHTCDNPMCVNPSHLQVGTKMDNTQDMMRKGRQKIIGAKGERVHGSKLTPELVIKIRAEYRAGGVSQYRLAERYAVSQPAIGKIVRHENWRHVK